MKSARAAATPELFAGNRVTVTCLRESADFQTNFNMKISKMRKAGKKRTRQSKEKEDFETGSKTEVLKQSFFKASKMWFVFLFLFSINEGIINTRNLNCLE